MITDIIVIYNDPSVRDTIENLDFSFSVFIEYLDRGSRLSKKKAKELMEEWGATQLPFVILKDKDKVVKCLYTEATNVINELTDIIYGNKVC